MVRLIIPAKRDNANSGGTVNVWLQQEPLFGGYDLETEIRLGDARERQDAKNEGTSFDYRVSCRLPSWVYHSLRHLVHSDSVPSFASAARFATRCGARVLANVGAMKDLAAISDCAYEIADGALLSMMGGQEYSFSSINTEHKTCKVAVFAKVHAQLSKMGHTTGLPLSTLTTAALVCGLAQSDGLIPDPYHIAFFQAFRHFVETIEERVAMLRRLVDNPAVTSLRQM